MHTEGSVQYPFTYSVSVTDARGCSSSDQVTLYCKRPTVEIVAKRDCCKTTLTAVGDGHDSISWSTGQTGTAVIDVTAGGTYTVTVSNPCGSQNASVSIAAPSGLSGPFNPVAAESRINPPYGSQNVSAVLHIKDVVIGSPPGIAGAPQAYNATQYILDIYDRWGNHFKTIPGNNCEGFTNWSIIWDGTDNSGNLVQQDTYVWKLSLKNCKQDWTPATVRRFERQCTRWRMLFGRKLWCRDYEVVTVEDPSGMGSVTVVY
jgi:hypothetical protein